MPEPETLAIIDGNSLLYRAYFALPMLKTTAGEPTNAVYGFTTMLFKVLEEQAPEMAAVCFDLPKPTFRHVQYAEYKATRPRTPDELSVQVPMARQMLEALRIPIFELEGFEADDLIGVLAERAQAAGYRVLIVTGDLDTLQLVSDTSTVLTTKRGITDTILYDRARVIERYGLEPWQLADLRALKGDATDNIPGVPGVGEKTAIALLRQFGSIENLYQHLDQVGSPKLAHALQLFEEQVRAAKTLASIATDAPLPVDLPCCRLQGPDRERLLELLRRFEFKSLLVRLSALAPAAEEPEAEVVIVDTPAGLAELRERLCAAPQFCFRLALPQGERGQLVGVAFALAEGPAHFVTLADGEESEQRLFEAGQAGTLADLAPVWSCPATKCCHNLKAALLAFHDRGMRVRGDYFDTMLASYLMNPLRQRHGLFDIIFDQLQIPPPEPFDLAAAWADGQVAEVAKHLGLQVDYLRRLCPVLEQGMAEQGLSTLYREVELPLVEVLARMELAGILLDREHLAGLASWLEARIGATEREIHALAGEEFTINSPKQLQRILFDKLGLRKGKRTKTGYSTGAETLIALAEEHAMVAKVLEYREYTKLKSTYVDALPRLVEAGTGRLHTSFNQTVTATGRLSSSDPNLQNIPIRSEIGQEIRRAFVAPPGSLLLSADYSQIELRVLAHISQDQALIEIFQRDEDLHTATASEIFSVPPDQVQPHMRRLAKVVNFGIPYGISAQGLARDLGVSAREAQEYMGRYFRRFAGVRDYMRVTVDQARERGLVTTVLGRRRAVPDIRAGSRALREFAERTAINTPIQGSAADIMKLAMLRVQEALDGAGTASRLLLQVHDELVLEVPEADLPGVARLVGEGMAGAYQLCVPLRVEVKAGPNWRDMVVLATS